VSRGAKIAGIVTWLVLFGLPLLLMGPWSTREIVAWAILSGIIAGAAAVAWEVAAAETGEAPKEPEPAAERTSWKDTVVFALGMTGVFAVLGTIGLVGEEGFGILVEPIYWGTFGFAFALSLVVSVLLRFAEVTRADVDEDDARRRAARQGTPADLPLLRSATPAVRRDWHRRAVRLARRAAASRVVFSLPVSVLVAYLTWKVVGEVISPVAGLVCMAVAAAGLEAIVLAKIRHQWGDPLLLVGRVIGGVHGVVVKGGQTPGLRDMAVTWLEHGYVRTLEVDVDEALTLRADGALEPVSSWNEQTRFGARRSLHRGVVVNEDCVLVCAGDGGAMLQLGDLAVRASRSAGALAKVASRRRAPSRRAS
jgi:hypothetical protein